MNYKIENAKISYYYSNNQEIPKHCFGLLNSNLVKKITNNVSSPLFIEISAKIRCAIEMRVSNRREFDVFFIQNNEPAQLLKKETIFNCARDRTFYVLIKPKPNSNKPMSITLDERWGPTRRLVDATLQVGNNDSDRLAPMESEKSLPLEVLESFYKAIAEPVKKPVAKRKAERFAPYSKSSNSKTTKKTSELMEQSTLENVFMVKNTEPTQSTGQSLNLLANTAIQLD